jgi:hypothetical protein
VFFVPLSAANWWDDRADPSSDWRQFTLQRAAYFGTFKSVRMIFAFMALLAGISANSAQEQESKLVDRILKRNLSLVNSAQNKKFDAAGTSVAKRAPSKSFYILDKSLTKSFPAARTFSPPQFAARHFRAGDITANVSTRLQLMTVDTIHLASASNSTRVAPENGKSLPAASFAGNRPFLGRGKSQEALSAQDTPLTIEQVRELLNKNK